MTPERVLAVLEKYEGRLTENWFPERAPSDQKFPALDDRIGHILWMCGETKKHVEEGKMEKAMRWLGFIQGVLWADNVFTIAEMKDDNR